MAGKPSVTSHFLKLLRRARCFKMRVMYLYILLHIHTVHMYIIDDIRYIACIYIYIIHYYSFGLDLNQSGSRLREHDSSLKNKN